MSFILRFWNPDIRKAIDDPSHPFWRRKKNPRLPNRLRTVIELLQEDPYSAAGSHPLRWGLAGIRAATLVGPWRLLFKICEECRTQNLHASHPLDCCRGEIQTQDRTVNILDVVDYHG